MERRARTCELVVLATPEGIERKVLGPVAVVTFDRPRGSGDGWSARPITVVAFQPLHIADEVVVDSNHLELCTHLYSLIDVMDAFARALSHWIEPEDVASQVPVVRGIGIARCDGSDWNDFLDVR